MLKSHVKESNLTIKIKFNNNPKKAIQFKNETQRSIRK